LNKTPLSTIVEIQNHGERFFDETDAAVEALNKIAERDEIWEAARAAKARADANPNDPAAQQAYRAARARFLHQRIQTFLAALKLEQVVGSVFAAFCNQLDIEIAAVRNQVDAEQEAVKQQSEKYRDYVDQLHQVRARIEGVQDLDPADVQLLQEIERALEYTENQKTLAKERELLATESLRDLEETKTQAGLRQQDLTNEFAQARGDLSLLQGIARNDWMIVVREQRVVVLDRINKGLPPTSAKNRQVVAELMERIRERQAARAAQPQPAGDSAADQGRQRVQAFLNNLPAQEPAATEPAPAPAPAARS